MSNFDVSIKDFQSIKEAKLSFVDGINIITGKSNSGKTAIIRAVDTALFNLGDDSMVRAGTRYAGVMLNNGKHKIVFRRDSHGKNEKTAYSIDGGKTVTKVGRMQLPEVENLFHISDVRMQNGAKMKLNFWYQNDKPFLTDRTAGQLYEFLSLSSCDDYTKVLKSMGNDLKTLEREIENTSITIKTLEDITKKKEEFVEENKGYTELYESIVKASRVERVISESEKLIESIEELTSRVDGYIKTLCEVNKELDKIPLQEIEEEYDRYIEMCTDYDRNYSCGREVSRLEDSIDVNEDLYSRIEKKLEENISVCRLVDIEELEGLEKVVRECNEDLVIISSREDEVQRFDNTLMSIEDCVSRNNEVCNSYKERIENIKNSAPYIEKVDNIFIAVEDNTRESIEIESTLSDILNRIKENYNELEEYKFEVGYCPYCNTVFERCGCGNEE